MTEPGVYQKHIAAASYAFLMLVIGVPVWWKTTEVYRAYVPYSDIASLETISVMQKANVLLITTDAEDSHLRGPIFQKTLAKSNMYDISLTVRVPQHSENEIIEHATGISEIDMKIGSGMLRNNPGSVAFLEVPSKLFSEVPHIVLGNHRTVYYSSYVPSEDLAAVAVDTILGEPQMNSMMRSLSAAATTHRPAPSDSARKRTIGHIDIFLSLLIPQPEYVSASWDIDAATQQYLVPFLDRFPLNFTIKSQVLYLTPLNIPAASSGSGPVELNPEDLGLAVNSVESVLASQSSNNPALNMLVYLPPVESAPMTIAESRTNSFLIPRWGGVHIYNYITKQSENVKFPLEMNIDVKKVMGVWVGQIRSLLGIEEVSEYESLPVPSVGIRDWEEDFQLRHRSLENILDSKSTLSSLSHLLSQIPNIVIREDIGQMVEKAVGKVAESSALVEEGYLVEGYQASREALELSETAFFDQSLLALLYFPDDQKYAIYIPFFLPVGIPVILSLKTLFKFIKGEMKSKSD